MSTWVTLVAVAVGGMAGGALGYLMTKVNKR